MHGSSRRIGSRALPWVCEACQTRLAVGRQHPRGFTRTSRQEDGLASLRQRQYKLPTSPARTRFAPSPTGDLHLGSIRTALFNYLLAKRTGGQFVLRIEDTDQKRTIPGAEDRLIRDLRWAGIEWDAGPDIGGSDGPYRQSERLDLYHHHIQSLLAKRKAYRCFCSNERLQELNASRHENGLPLGYDRRCRSLSQSESDERAAAGESHTVRFEVPPEYPKYDDLVYGKSGHGEGRSRKFLSDQPVWDDPVLIKSDGFPTYHFANVVDDKAMQITHVIRGSEWMASTPLHIALYDAFAWKHPRFGHVPLLVKPGGQKLSKRDFDSDVASYRDVQHIFPDALLNFVVLLGWSHQQKSDLFTLDELKQVFDLKMTKGNTIVAFEKLDFLQEKHASQIISRKREGFDDIVQAVTAELLKVYGPEKMTSFVGKRTFRDVIISLLTIDSLPYKNSKQFVESLDVFLKETTLRQTPDLPDFLRDKHVSKDICIAVSTLFLIPEEQWLRDTFRLHFSQIHFAKDRKKAMYQFLRWTLVAGAKGPDIPATLEALGKDISHSRLQQAIEVARDIQNEAVSAEIPLYRTNKVESGERWRHHTLSSSP